MKNATMTLIATPVIIVGLGVSACSTLSDYNDAARAGVAAQGAFSNAITATRYASVNYSTQAAAAFVNDLPQGERRSEYRSQLESLRQQIRHWEVIQQHSEALGSYFAQLEVLASTDAPSRTSDSVSAALGQVGAIGQTLGRELGIEGTASSVIQELVRAGLSAYQRYTLQRVILDDGEFIAAQIDLQLNAVQFMEEAIFEDTQAASRDRLAAVASAIADRNLNEIQRIQIGEELRDELLDPEAERVRETMQTARASTEAMTRLWEALVRRASGDLTASELVAIARELADEAQQLRTTGTVVWQALSS